MSFRGAPSGASQKNPLVFETSNNFTTNLPGTLKRISLKGSSKVVFQEISEGATGGFTGGPPE